MGAIAITGLLGIVGLPAFGELLPLALESEQAGREIQGPMALVILGGLVTSTIMSLLFLPALILRFGNPAARSLEEPTCR